MDKQNFCAPPLAVSGDMVSVGPIGAHLLIVKSELPAADAIVVMSGSATYIERTNWAARLYRQDRAPIVILTSDGLISGWNEAEQRNPYFYELAAKELQQQGVPADKIRIITGALSEPTKRAWVCASTRALITSSVCWSSLPPIIRGARCGLCVMPAKAAALKSELIVRLRAGRRRRPPDGGGADGDGKSSPAST